MPAHTFRLLGLSLWVVDDGGGIFCAGFTYGLMLFGGSVVYFALTGNSNEVCNQAPERCAAARAQSSAPTHPHLLLHSLPPPPPLTPPFPRAA